jgi:diaminohydroxyphosphoribosylaminopyrimidine deaminase/5-amino-6-(5-phosphoribosylamino)uracil reductase
MMLREASQLFHERSNTFVADGDTVSKDRSHMSAALALAARGLGATWPNPSVGCVIVSAAGQVVGRGRTGIGGRPHAETQALSVAGAAARGGTAYVTLEPCSHHGKTPPCADALIAAGVSRVVVAAGDPDPRVNGQGLARLRAAGITVLENFMAAEAAETLAGFFARIKFGRPLVTLKMASTLDGRIATSSGESQWITGAASRRAVHALRGQHDAVMVGVGTALADDPDLTCRLPGYAARPTVRIVADGFLRTPANAKLVVTSHQNPTFFLHHAGAPRERVRALETQGARCIEVLQGEQGIDLHEALAALGALGLTRVLVEGGAGLASSLFRSDLVDRIFWFHAPGVIGGDGMPAVHALGIKHLAEMKRFRQMPLEADVMTALTKQEESLLF